MFKSLRLAIMGAALFLLPVQAHAALFFALDADPGTPGVQSSIEVLRGTDFTVEVLVTELPIGSPSVFDALSVGLEYNTGFSGPVLAPGPGGASWELITAPPSTPVAAFDLVKGSFVGTGSAAVPAPGGFPSPFDVAGPYLLIHPSGPFAIPLSVPISVLRIGFSATQIGMTEIEFAVGPGATGASFGGSPLSIGPTTGAFISVVPEPLSVLTFGAGLAGIGLIRRRRRT